jgi:hypothetical protein
MTKPPPCEGVRGVTTRAPTPSVERSSGSVGVRRGILFAWIAFWLDLMMYQAACDWLLRRRSLTTSRGSAITPTTNKITEEGSGTTLK